jgi:hypothetical protein
MVYSYLSFQFWLYAFLTPLIFLITFYLPGVFFIDRVKPRSRTVSFLLSVVLGIVLWGVQGYLFGYLHMRWLSYIYLLFFMGNFLLHFSQQKTTFIQLRKVSTSFFTPAVIFIGIGTVLQVLSVIGSGVAYTKGVEFFFTNAVDGMMHLAYIQSIARSFPPQEPSAAGMMLTNYHYWSDLVMAELVRVWHIPVSHLFFQFMPLLVSGLTGMSTYLLVRSWKGSKQTAMWALFLLYFSADAAYIFMIAIHRQLSFQTPAIDNGITQFLNIPHTFAKLVFLTGLIPFSYWLQTKKKKWLFLAITFFATLAGFKIYFGIFAAIGVCLVALGQLLQVFFSSSKKNVIEKALSTFYQQRVSLLGVILLAVGASLIYFPANKSSGSLFYSPLEWPKIFMGPDGINFREWWLRHQVYDQYHNTRNIVVLDLFAIIMCLVSIYGTRLMGFIRWKKTIREIGWEMYLFFFPGILFFTWLGLYTLQKSGLFNVFNFFVVASVGLSLFTAFWLGKLTESKSLPSKIILILFVVFTLPRPLHEIFSMSQAYATNHYDLIIDNQEIEALKAIQNSTTSNKIIQAHFNNENDRKTPYISFFSNRSTYLSGEGLLASHNQPIEGRLLDLKSMFLSPNGEAFARSAKQKNISFIYLLKKDGHIDGISFPIDAQQFHEFFENDRVKILERSE